MDIIANSIQKPNPMNRFYAFITDRVLIAVVLALLAVYALVRKPNFMLYIILGLSGSMLAGYIFQINVL
jgi:hypothetical protein